MCRGDSRIALLVILICGGKLKVESRKWKSWKSWKSGKQRE